MDWNDTYIEWKEFMPLTEQKIEVGQNRVVFIDGIGDFDATIEKIGIREVTIIDKEGEIWLLPWDCIGILTNGEEMRKIEEENAKDKS